MGKGKEVDIEREIKKGIGLNRWFIRSCSEGGLPSGPILGVRFLNSAHGEAGVCGATSRSVLTLGRRSAKPGQASADLQRIVRYGQLKL
jgi:hypothetical protein